MEKLFCQSCGMPMNDKDLMGTNEDGTINEEYCTYCFKEGKFTDENITMEKMIDICVFHMKKEVMDEDEARKMMNSFLPTLKRWRK